MLNYQSIKIYHKNLYNFQHYNIFLEVIKTIIKKKVLTQYQI